MMMKTISELRIPGQTDCGYEKYHYCGDVLHDLYLYKDIEAVYQSRSECWMAEDRLIGQLQKCGLVSEADAVVYNTKLSHFLPVNAQTDAYTPAQIYRLIQELRIRCFGKETMERSYLSRMQDSLFSRRYKAGGFSIDQRQKKADLIDHSDALLLVLTQPEWFAVMLEDLDRARSSGKEIYLLVNEEEGMDLPAKSRFMTWLTDWKGITCIPVKYGSTADMLDKVRLNDRAREFIEKKEMSLLYYGEDGFLTVCGMKMDAVIHGVPSFLYTQAVTGIFIGENPCVVFVPAGFDIRKWVRLKERSRLTYGLLAELWRQYGEEIYDMDTSKLYCRYPWAFINMYAPPAEVFRRRETGPLQIDMPADAETLPVRDVFRMYDTRREQVITSYLNRWDGLRFFSCYYDENLSGQPVCWDHTPKQGIMVQGIRLRRAAGSQVLITEEDMSVRKLLRQNPGKEGSLRIVSNFLFFMTPVLEEMYNRIREDRREEQAMTAGMHLDYSLTKHDDVRTETFPLYRKSCIAMLEDGSFRIFSFRLGAGCMRVFGSEEKAAAFEIRWKKADVDVPEIAGQETVIYTPYYSLEDTDSGDKCYRKAVGGGRVNLVVIKDRIAAIREGDVILPSVGVVVSLKPDLGRAVLETLGAKRKQDDYFDISELRMSLVLERPEDISEDDWNRVQWAYGGGLSLISAGESIFESGAPLEKLKADGWLSPLSQQTQESRIHTLEKHPRTAIGFAGDGDLVILVFSGRTGLSTGADYREMCVIAQDLVPDIRELMNVDGGGSAMLGAVVEGEFMELSYPSTSSGSCAGMARPVKTLFCIDINSKEPTDV